MRNRREMIALLPKGKVGAEIGVLAGDFSEILRNVTLPKELWLIDAWEFQSGAYEIDPCDRPQCVQNARYEYVCTRFQKHPSVKVLKSYSVDAADRFDAGYFDWLYLDACHLYDAVVNDMQAWWSKLKSGGFFLGHDYLNGGHIQVKAAVDRFLESVGLKVQLVTEERKPSWLVRKP